MDEEQIKQTTQNDDNIQPNAINTTIPPKKRLILLPLIGIAVLVCLAVAAYFIFKKSDTKVNVSSTEPTVSNTTQTTDTSSNTQNALKDCFGYLKDAPKAASVTTPKGFTEYTSVEGRFAIAQPTGWTAKLTTRDVNAPDVCTGEDVSFGDVTFSSPSGTKLVVRFGNFEGGRGGDCTPAPIDLPFKLGNACPSSQPFGLLSKGSVSDRTNWIIKNSYLPHTCYKTDPNTGGLSDTAGTCPNKDNYYIYGQKYSSSKGYIDAKPFTYGPLVEAPVYVACLTYTQSIDASSMTNLESKLKAGDPKMGYLLPCYDTENAFMSTGYFMAAFAIDAKYTDPASLQSQDMRQAITALSTIQILP